MKEGKLQVMPHEWFKQWLHDDIRLFMHDHGIYVLPTQELIGWLNHMCIDIDKSIEICCGNGAIGRSLGIPFTDRKLQEDPKVMTMYKLMKQPLINYPADVEKLTANQAVEKYGPTTVIAAFATHKFKEGIDIPGQTGNTYGVDEDMLLDRYGVQRYIHIGNDTPSCGHIYKHINKREHTTFHYPWLITRGELDKAHIKVWDNK